MEKDDEEQTIKKDLLKKAQLKIAKEIKRICDKHNINYFLDAGSLLGAIRHQGFIPWDDDMDIGMLDKDYEKFIKIAPQELGEEFFLDNYELDKDCNIVFSKVRLKNTLFREKLGPTNAKHKEIFVDIFSYFPRPENKFKRNIQSTKLRILSQVFMAQSGFKLWENKSGIYKLKYVPIILLSKTSKKDKTYQKINKICKECKDTRIIGVHDGMTYHYWFYDRKYLDNFTQAKFENEYFKIPEKYHEILSIVYGDDYMELPPQEKRVNHEILELDLGDIEKL